MTSLDAVRVQEWSSTPVTTMVPRNSPVLPVDQDHPADDGRLRTLTCDAHRTVVDQEGGTSPVSTTSWHTTVNHVPAQDGSPGRAGSRAGSRVAGLFS